MEYLNKNFGLTGPQLVMLQELSDGELTVSGLARRISLSQDTVTDIIHRLEKKDLIKEFFAALLRGKRCERSELPFESRACSGVHTFDLLRIWKLFDEVGRRVRFSNDNMISQLFLVL